ncbi:MAG: sterol carrier family protein [Actinomycetota bacterium]|nr:sterol carrier family protein [Actinomycetota bacterium]
MPTSRRFDPAAVAAALAPVRGWLGGEAAEPPRSVLATAVRVSLRAFAQRHPGRAVEVRVPPFAAIQCLVGQTHTRGTPPHVVQTDARSWLELVTGRLSWADAVADGVVQASGHRAAEVGELLPMPLL